jgi:hypothetical protein
VPVRQHDALEIAALLFGKADIGHDEIDAGRFMIPEGNAHIDADPLTAIAGSEAIEREIHSDLADAAERRKQKFLLKL